MQMDTSSYSKLITNAEKSWHEHENETKNSDGQLGYQLWSEIATAYLTKQKSGHAVSEVDIAADQILNSHLPGLDITGFDREAPSNDDSLLHSFKHMFVSDSSNGQLIHDAIERKYEQNPSFRQENAAMEDYQAKLNAWNRSEIVPPPPMPEAPNCPLHKQMEEQVRSVERDLTRQVLNQMSPEDRQRLEKDNAAYLASATDPRRDNPLGPTEMGPMPEQTNAMKDYGDRVSAATQQWLKQNGGEV